MNPYPKDIKNSDFTVGGVTTTFLLQSHHAARSLNYASNKSTIDTKTCGPDDLYLRSLTTGVKSNTSYKSTDRAHDDIPSSDASRYCFAPVKEDVWIRWKHLHPELIKESKLQLYCHINGRLTLIWTKTFIWDDCPADGKTLFRGNLTTLNADLDKGNNPGLNSVTLDYDRGTFDPLFPGECVTSEFSPYKLRLTVKPISSATVSKPASVWMYFDIRVHSLDFEWCPAVDLDKVLPHTNKDRNLAVCRSLADAADNDNLNGAVPPPGQTKKVYLKSHSFYQSANELTDITYYNRYRTLWGDGPVIPVLAKASIRDSSGEGVDAPLGLGKVKFMWDWVDKAAAPYNVIGDAGIQTWMDDSHDYKAAETAESPAGKNCHVDRGGKRGIGAKTCFPQQAGKAPTPALAVHDNSDQMFPFKVEPLNGAASPFAARRKWAAYSYSWASGVLAGKTGVLFQPSRMAGDGYELHVYLAYDTDNKMENNADPTSMPAGLHKHTGVFQIWRELDIVKHWRMKTASPIGNLLDLAASKTKFAKYFIKLNLPPAVDHNLGAWFGGLQNVVNGNPPPVPALDDFIRAAVDPAQQGHLIHLIDYDAWYNKMLAAHGPTDAALANWANLQTNGLDVTGQPRLHGWEYMQGGNGMQPIVRPWALNFAPDQILTTAGTIRIAFPGLMQGHPPAQLAPLDITFERKKHRRIRKETVSTAQRAQIKAGLQQALQLHHQALGENNLVSYQRGAVPHTPVNVQLSGLQDTASRRDRLAYMRQILEELMLEICKEKGKNNYEFTNAKLGWGFIMFDAVLDNLLGAQEGIVALQATDLSNMNLPTGKAFYANAAGNRATAATLAPDPLQQTFEHEIGHALFLCHTYKSQETSDPNYLHQKTNPSAGNCVMDKGPSGSCQPTSLFCGFCIARLWGWSFQTVDPATGAIAGPVSRTLWYDSDYNKNPGSPAPIPPHPTGGDQQSEQLKVEGSIGAGQAGDANVTVTAAGMANSPKTIPVTVAENDDAVAVAGKVRTALAADADVSAFFAVSGNGDKVKIAAQVKAADDPTMSIAIDNGTCAGLNQAAADPASHKAGAVAPLHPV